MLEEILREGFAAYSLPLDAQALSRYRLYADRLEETNKVMNLTAITGEDEIARLHFLDSAALLSLSELSGKRVIDVGTGAGFPGLALKIACPEIELTLLDSLDKRIAFLRETVEALGFEDVVCLHARAEEVPQAWRGGFDVAVSRAVARLNILCELCLPLVKTGGLFLAMKGTDHAEELAEARRAVRLLGGEIEDERDYTIPGTDVAHSVIVIRKAADTPPKYPRRWAQIKKTPL
ncbi:MAG: 16S rRNA (guanine(527)-N(7))-methyltransferase RsmG [Oscillospiraceae bacterium]|nr:16S rRNA (guanine(527)-N(7))-methyltransferase RsmG [Oscillospiraceae bacterium]